MKTTLSTLARQHENRNGDPYLSAIVDRAALHPYLDALRSYLGENRANRYILNLKRRNAGTFHITVLSPFEYGKVFGRLEHNVRVHGHAVLHGVGCVQRPTEETYYIVVTCSEFAHFRHSLDLPPRDFHITLGFRTRDIHNVRKDLRTLLKIN